MIKIIQKITGLAIISTTLLFTASAKEVDILITHGNILTLNKDMEEIKDGYIAITDNKITALGSMEALDQITAKEVLNVEGDIVMPGMINTHTHASMSVFRSLADDVPDRLHRYIFPLEAEFVSPEMVRIGAQLANIEMIKGGVTTYADMYYFEDIVAKTVDEAGMRAVLGETVIKFPVADAENAEEGIAYAIKFIETYKNHPRITPAFAPHAPYTNTTETLQKIAKLSLEYDVPVLIHLAESQRESDVIAERSGGLTPIAYMADIGALNKNLIAAHAITANDEDIQLLKQYNVGVAHNMSANIKSAKGVAPIPKMRQAGVSVGLGTDGPMSGNTISVLDEFQQVAKIHKLIAKDRSLMPPIEIVKMATLGGAEVLGLDEEIGSLEINKKADIVVVDTKAPHMTPLYNPYSALVYSAYASDIRHNIIDGKIIMKDRVVLTVDEKEARKQAIDFSQKVRDFLIEKGEKIQ